jgi:hypothetical protein
MEPLFVDISFPRKLPIVAKNCLMIFNVSAATDKHCYLLYVFEVINIKEK